MNSIFHEQLGDVADLFEQWGPCERTVMACALARRVPWPGLKLVQRAVEAALRLHDEDERLEQEANDETMLAGLLNVKSDEDCDEGGERLKRLVSLLPLLRADNGRGKELYVAAAPALVQRCVDAPRRRLAPQLLCRQLLSYLLVHPALTAADHATLTQWLRYLENHMTGNRTTDTVWQQRIEPCLLPELNIWGVDDPFRRTIGKNVEFRGLIDPRPDPDAVYTADLLQESFSKNGRDVDISIESEKLNFDAAVSVPKSQRSNSLTPPSTAVIQTSSSSENLSDEPLLQKPRSFSLSSEHSLGRLRPMSVLYGTTGSETRLDDLKSHDCAAHPGMSTVAQWLKSLRLHKYIWLFTNVTYDQMMAMDEEYLEKLGVTKGARHKILLSIAKLQERGEVLAGVEAELSAGAGVGAAGVTAATLERLRGVLLSPMPPGSELPVRLVRLLDRAAKVISAARGGAGGGAGGGCAGGDAGDDSLEAVDPMALHCWLVEKALHHESFARPELQVALRRLRHRLPPRQFFTLVNDMPLTRRCLKPRWRGSGPGAGRGMRGGGGGGPGGGAGGARRWAGQWRAPPPRGKSHSYPPFPPHAHPRHLHLPQPPQPPQPPHPPQPQRLQRAPPAPAACQADDYSGLDALCLQMTEQAID